MKLIKTYKSIALALALLLIITFAKGATITSTANGGNWESPSTWVGNKVPSTTDDVVIATIIIITTKPIVIHSVDGNSNSYTCASLTINSGAILNMNRPLIVNGTTSITGRVNFGSTNSTPRLMTFNGAVTLNIGAVWNEYDTDASPIFAFLNSFTNNSATINTQTGTHTFSGTSMSINGTTETSIPNVVISGTYTNNGILTVGNVLTVNGGLTNGATGILNLGKTFPTTKITATAIGNTVNYYGINQTCIAINYYNLILSGSGLKTLANIAISIAGNLLISGATKASISAGVNINAVTLTLGPSNKTSGTWGSIISGATNPNNTYFEATATGKVIVLDNSTLSISAGGGGTFCTGTTINLTSTGTNNINRYWTSNNGFYSQDQNPVLSNVTSAMAGTYTVTGSSLSGINLVSNGDFESQYTGFTTDYIKNTTSLQAEGTYAVIEDPHSEHSDFSDCLDHTPSGKFQMVVNGATVAGKKIWSESISVIQNTNYQYSYWVQSVYPDSPVQFQFSINGVDVGPINKTATNRTCEWNQIIYNWNSGTSTTAILTLININTIATGNDFSMDDIVFQQVIPATSSVNVIVTPTVGTPTTPSPSFTSIIQGSTNTVYTTSATNATSYTWTVTGAGNTISGTGPTGTVTWATGFSGTASVTVTATGCDGTVVSSTSGATVTVRPPPTATIGGTTTVCQNTTNPNITFNNPQTLPVTVTYNINGANPSTINIAGTSATIAVPTSVSGTFAYNLVSVAYQTDPISSNNISGMATVTVTIIPSATITYGTPFCKTLNTTQAVTLKGTDAYAGGTYSSTQGLVINSVTGDITPNLSTAGVYEVTYTIPSSGGCAAIPATTSVTITTPPVATFIYAGNPFPTLNGIPVSGKFSSTPAGLVFVNTVTGEVNLTTSSAGTYTVTNTIVASGGCSSVTASNSIIITALQSVGFMWEGSISTDWNNPNNWASRVVPNLTSDAIIPDTATTVHDPILPLTMPANVKTISLLINAILNGGTATTMTVAGSKSAWLNRGTLNAGTSTVRFTNLNATMDGQTNFYNVAIETGAGLTTGSNNIMRIEGELKMEGSGVLNAVTPPNTIEYNGTDQTVINPNGSSPGYYNLILSGSGVKTLPITYLSIVNDFSLAGSATSSIIGGSTIGRNLAVADGSLLAIAPTSNLTVSGEINNTVGKSGFVLQSDVAGSASLMHNTNNVQATVKRYINGAKEAWHFISSPVADQPISGDWLPPGNYGDTTKTGIGTGYDLYLWNEPNSCWIYKLNLSSPINWFNVHPGSNFSKGRGYLYSCEALNPTKEFAGNLNNGTITYPLTINSKVDTLKGFNLIGNPYPSSIDWQATSGWARSNLVGNSVDGYNMWIWNPAANNYGVFNSASGKGTNFVTRYIASMQGFYVQASNAGDLSMDNNVRVHEGAGDWKSAKINPEILSVVVQSEADQSFDEAQLLFGYETNKSGARKRFSDVLTAPSLYMQSEGENLSVRYLTDTTDNPKVLVMFKAGINGNYTFKCNFDFDRFETVMLEDRQTNTMQNLKVNNTYSFKASKSDYAKRFVLYFSSVKNLSEKELPARVFTNNIQLIVDLTLVSKETAVFVYDIMGRQLLQQKLQCKSLHNLDINSKKQILIVYLKNQDGTFYRKILWGGN